jgi:hypothetical protein
MDSGTVRLSFGRASSQETNLAPRHSALRFIA